MPVRLRRKGSGNAPRIRIEEEEIRVATLNIASFTEAKVHMIGDKMEKLGIDVLLIQDTHLTERDITFRKVALRNRLGHGIKIFAKGTEKNRVGGVMTIVSQRWAGVIAEVWYEQSGLGLLQSLDICTARGNITIFNTYWPYKNLFFFKLLYILIIMQKNNINDKGARMASQYHSSY